MWFSKWQRDSEKQASLHWKGLLFITRASRLYQAAPPGAAHGARGIAQAFTLDQKVAELEIPHSPIMIYAIIIPQHCIHYVPEKWWEICKRFCLLCQIYLPVLDCHWHLKQSSSVYHWQPGSANTITHQGHHLLGQGAGTNQSSFGSVSSSLSIRIYKYQQVSS